MFPEMKNPTKFAKSARSFEDNCKNHAIYDVISELQDRLSELGDENVHGVIAMIIAKDASESMFTFTPSCYEADSAYAMSLANVSMIERMIHDEAENFRIANLADECDEDDDL